MRTLLVWMGIERAPEAEAMAEDAETIRKVAKA